MEYRLRDRSDRVLVTSEKLEDILSRIRSDISDADQFDGFDVDTLVYSIDYSRVPMWEPPDDSVMGYTPGEDRRPRGRHQTEGFS